MMLHFTDDAWEDYQYWLQTDKAVLKRINTIIQDMQRNPFDGIGKPEPLRHSLSGYYSRRINQEHRIVYRADDSGIWLISLRFHYSG
ncbi:Txe/YoeB family addiction module toxin [Neisseria animalis]|uniref:Putative mRNA interferase YoeB n=1 Tax=Neisseria animalis TaxID=492 RepID=A0A5P3MRK1_NEIAN|nr:Txe/YoeB family addiction module toxin [Neisseria animalis]QEY24222.1 Txe/YoeB family addiction module toxin [Neisseria animalis]ROW32169.1 Txe/YoeB family addiction module toxin [Neisseria animalis]VEE06553.1 Toxin YoeB [Neisseria animalis]